jgi:hypothetical protein
VGDRGGGKGRVEKRGGCGWSGVAGERRLAGTWRERDGEVEWAGDGCDGMRGWERRVGKREG